MTSVCVSPPPCHLAVISRASWSRAVACVRLCARPHSAACTSESSSKIHHPWPLCCRSSELEAPAGRWVPDQTKVPPVLVPLLSLGQRAVTTEDGGARAGTFSNLHGLGRCARGRTRELQATHLSVDLFEAAAMNAV